MMIKIIVLLGIIVISGLAFGYDQWDYGQPRKQAIATLSDSQMPMPQNAKPVPQFSFHTVNNEYYSIRTMSEPAVILHFWATWCAPCLVELPQLLKRVAEADGRLALVAVALDETPGSMTQFLTQRNMLHLSHVYWVWDQDKNISLTLFNTSIPPETILINPEHLMSEKIIGDPIWSSSVMQQKLDQLVTIE